MDGDGPGRLTTDERPGWARLVLSGRVTVARARAFHDLAQAALAGGTDLTVDCAGTEYLDVSALQVLVCLGRELVRRGKRFDIAGVPDGLAADLRLAGLGKPGPAR